MVDRHEVRVQAERLAVEHRRSILQSFKETDFHKQLEALFSAMDSSLKVSVIHGPSEFGKDLVVVRDDAFGTTANAVIVKMGGLTGNAAGPIDDIKSQMEMSMTHPARLPQRVEEVRISEVWLVIVGRISENARQRLCSELPRAEIKFFDLDRLVDDFTEYFPEVFFGGHTLDFMLEAIDALERSHVFWNKNLTLTECFVDPFVVRSEVAMDDGGEALPIILRDRKLPFKKLRDLPPSERKVVVVGDAGSGKSTALRKLAIDGLRSGIEQLGDDATHTARVPLYCVANSLGTCDSVADFDAGILEPAALPAGLTVDTLLVDALDEVPAAARRHVLEMAERIADEKGYRVVLSSRRIDLVRDPVSGWATYELMPLEFGQAITLFERVVGSPETLGVLKEGLEHVSGCMDLTPLSLMLLVELAERYHEIPASVTELYDRYTDQVLGKYDREKGIEVLFEYEVKKRFLGRLAYDELVSKNRLEMSASDFAVFGAKYFEEYEWSAASWDEFVGELERACVLRFRADGSVQLSHRSFVEFFAAYHLTREQAAAVNRDSVAVSLYFDPIWADVAFYYFGLLKDISAETLEAIFSVEDKSGLVLVSKFTVGRLLQAAWHSKADTRRDGLARATQYAVPVRADFMEFASKSRKPIPPIVGDFVLLSLASSAFKSRFLEKQLATLLERSVAPTEDEVIPALCLFAGLEPFLGSDERDTLVNKFLEVLAALKDKSIEARGLVYLMVLTDDDGELRKTVGSRWKQFSSKYNGVLRGVLPPHAIVADHKKKRRTGTA